jgi:hypothetical protein
MTKIGLILMSSRPHDSRSQKGPEHYLAQRPDVRVGTVAPARSSNTLISSASVLRGLSRSIDRVQGHPGVPSINAAVYESATSEHPSRGLPPDC